MLQTLLVGVGGIAEFVMLQTLLVEVGGIAEFVMLQTLLVGGEGTSTNCNTPLDTARQLCVCSGSVRESL